MKICIIGGGASGMMAAITMAKLNPSLDITLIEKKEKLGSKIYATGNGRCNITNRNCIGFGETVKGFREIGVEIKVTDEGRAYPVSEQAKDVVFALENAINAYGIKTYVNHQVVALEMISHVQYKVVFENTNVKKAVKEEIFDSVIIATGGKSQAHFGTTGDGYKMAENLGHKVNKLLPALVPVECHNDILGNMAGIRVKGKATMFRHGFYVDEQFGEIQFTKDGLSGICIFNMSSFVRINDKTKFDDYIIELDLLSSYKDMEIFYLLTMRKNVKGLETKDFLNSLVNREIAYKIIKPISDEIRWTKDLKEEHIKEIISLFRHIKFNVTGVKGWKEAQCTAGGVSWDEFDEDTMESKKCKGLYFTGEVIDYDGPCGGYNLENAWKTARKAGKNICIESVK